MACVHTRPNYTKLLVHAHVYTCINRPPIGGGDRPLTNAIGAKQVLRVALFPL